MNHQTRPVLAGVVSFNEIAGYWRWLGRGLMTMACQAMTRLAFGHYGLEKVQISTAAGNTRAGRS